MTFLLDDWLRRAAFALRLRFINIRLLKKFLSLPTFYIAYRRCCTESKKKIIFFLNQ